MKVKRNYVNKDQNRRESSKNMMNDKACSYDRNAKKKTGNKFAGWGNIL